MLKKISIVVLLLLFSKNSTAQNITNVPHQSLIETNPSFAGSNGFIRNQTFVQAPVDNEQDYFSFNNAFDTYLSSIKSGVAVSVKHYQYSQSYKSTSGVITYAKYFTVKEHLKVIPSIQVGYTARQINVGYNVNSVFIQTGSNSPWVRSEYFSLNAGLLVNYKNFYGGVSLFNINRPDVGIYGTQRANNLYNIHASYNMRVSAQLLFNLYAQYSTQKNYENQSVAISALIFKHLIYGIGYRWRDAAVMNVGCRTNYFVVQICYNKNISGLRPSDDNRDYWQLTMSFNLRNKEKRNTLITNFEAW